MIKTIYLKDNMTINKNISDKEYISYLAINMTLRRGENLYYINPNSLAYLLCGIFPPDKKLIDNIISGTLGLFEKFIVTVCQQVRQYKDKQYEWVIDTDLMGIPKENDTTIDYYTVANEDDIQKVLNIDSKYYNRTFSLVRFYVYLLSTIFRKDKYKGVGFTSIQDMVDITGHSNKTIQSYLKQLEELELIYVYRAKDFIKFDDGTFIEISHTYGRYCDKDIVVQLGQAHENEYGSKFKNEYKKIKKVSGDKTRANSQKYNRMVRELGIGNKSPYNYDECKEIFLSMCVLNKRYENESRNNRIKDLSVFKEYDFYSI